LSLATLTTVFASLIASEASAAAIEKDTLKLGFIKLTDCASLVIAKEKGFFEKEGLYVTLEAQANWKILQDRVVSGELDGAHMLAGQPIAASIGVGTKAALITALSLDLNGNAITLSKELWAAMKARSPELAVPKPPHPISAALFKPIVDEARDSGSAIKMGMVFPVSTHNYELRYWLAAGGIHPGFYTPSDPNGVTDADVQISVTPPPQMPATLAQGTIQGYSVGEPWNQQAVLRDIGVPVITDGEIWTLNPEKVFGVTADWAKANPETHLALLRALILAGKWLDASLENRREAVTVLSKPEYVGADPEVIANSMTGTFEYERGDKRELPDFNVFFRHHATYPFYSDAVWYLTQMRRWGQIPEGHPDTWYEEAAKQVYRPELWKQAATALVERGDLQSGDLPEGDGYKPPSSAFIDQVEYDGRKPNDYLKRLAIGRKD
jgi:nitrate/nitrite transport system substrate-binding protein